MAKKGSAQYFGKIKDEDALKFFAFLDENKGALKYLSVSGTWQYLSADRAFSGTGDTPYEAVATIPEFGDFKAPQGEKPAVLEAYMVGMLGAMSELKVGLRHSYGVWLSESPASRDSPESVDSPERALWWNKAIAQHLEITPAQQYRVVYL